MNSAYFAVGLVAVASLLLGAPDLGDRKAAAAPTRAANAAPPAFATCKGCHSVADGGAHGIGPNLFGVVGANAGSKAGFAYSSAMKAAKIRWARAKLDAYLADPKAVVPGTRMMIPGIADPAKRSDVIAYLETLK